MTEIEETPLPGVGVRYDFVTRAGRRIGVITHRTGHRELLVYDPRDPDAASETLRLEDEETQALVEMLGGSQVTAHQAELQSVEGLSIDWLQVDPTSACAGATIGAFGLRSRTGATIVAVVRDGQTLPSPGAEFRLYAGDTAVAVGTPVQLQRAFAMLRGVTPRGAPGAA